MKPTQIKSLQRESRHLNARLLAPGKIQVQSATDPRSYHLVQYDFLDDDRVVAQCTCPWGQHHGVGCSHVMAALEHLASLKGRTLSFWPSHEAAARQNRKIFLLTQAPNEADGLWLTSRNA